MRPLYCLPIILTYPVFAELPLEEPHDGKEPATIRIFPHRSVSLQDLQEDKESIEKSLALGDPNLLAKRQRSGELFRKWSAAIKRHPDLTNENVQVDSAIQRLIEAATSAEREAAQEKLDQAITTRREKCARIPELEKLRLDCLAASSDYRKDLLAAVAADVDGAQVIKQLASLNPVSK